MFTVGLMTKESGFDDGCVLQFDDEDLNPTSPLSRERRLASSATTIDALKTPKFSDASSPWADQSGQQTPLSLERTSAEQVTDRQTAVIPAPELRTPRPVTEAMPLSMSVPSELRKQSLSVHEPLLGVSLASSSSLHSDDPDASLDSSCVHSSYVCTHIVQSRSAKRRRKRRRRSNKSALKVRVHVHAGSCLISLPRPLRTDRRRAWIWCCVQRHGVSWER